MRTLAALGGLGLLASATLAQQPVVTDFATGNCPAVGCAQPTVSVLPPAPVSVGYVSRICYTPEMLLKLPECELIKLYKCSPPGPVPGCYTPGLVIYKPGSLITVPLACVLKYTAWQGKYFPDPDTMVNRQFGVPTVRAAIYPGDSWLDGGPSLIFDYEDTSLVCTRYRDEVREISPGVYLGIMHRRAKDGPKLSTWFAIDARGKGCCIPGGK
jgi:hypothetical protein